MSAISAMLIRARIPLALAVLFFNVCTMKGGPIPNGSVGYPSSFAVAETGPFDGYSIELRDGRFWHRIYERGKTKEKVLQTPLSSQWQVFWRGLQKAGVWEWVQSYEYNEPNVQINDGARWRVKIKWADKAVDSTGNNAYPSDTNLRLPRRSNGKSKVFGEFESALRILFGIKNLDKLN